MLCSSCLILIGEILLVFVAEGSWVAGPGVRVAAAPLSQASHPLLYLMEIKRFPFLQFLLQKLLSLMARKARGASTPTHALEECQ